MKSKKGDILNKVVVEIILVGILFALFLYINADKVNARGVRQQVLEKQTALLIDSAVPGMSFEIKKDNLNGRVSDIKIREGRIFVTVQGLASLKGYPYFSPYSVSVKDEGTKFVVYIK